MNQQNVQALWPHIHSLTVLAAAGSFTAAAQPRHQQGRDEPAHRRSREGGRRAARAAHHPQRAAHRRGQTLVDSTRDAFESIGQHFARVKELAGEPRGLLRVTAPVALGRQQVVPHLPDFLRQHPGVHIELDLSDRLHSLTQEGFDLAIRHTTTAPQTHVAWKLCDTRSLLVASRDYLMRAARRVTRASSSIIAACAICATTSRPPGASSPTAGAASA